MSSVWERWFGLRALLSFLAGPKCRDVSPLSTRSPEAEDAAGFWTECFWTALAGLLTMAIGGLMILLTPGEFWRDDFQSSMMPGYTDVHRAFRKGASP